MPDGVLCNTSLSIKLPSPSQGKAERISTSPNTTPPSGQGTKTNSGFPLLSQAAHSQRAIPVRPAAPARARGHPGLRQQQPFNQVSAYQWLIVAMRQHSE